MVQLSTTAKELNTLIDDIDTALQVTFMTR
jgi:hypothetical protein